MRKFTLFWLTVVVFIILLAACSSENRGILLRYTPEIGSSYPYKFSINHPKVPIELTANMQVVEKNENGYLIQFPDFSNELFPGFMIITERHNTSHPGFISLNFPNDPVKVGGEWQGQIPWYYENFYVLESTDLFLPASYELKGIEQGEKGQNAVIEQRTETDLAVDGLVFYIGHVGVQWNHDGQITGVNPGYDAYQNLRSGDLVIGINGKYVDTASELSLLAEENIQHPKQDKTVTFSILRDGMEYNIDVQKSIDKFAVVKVYNKVDIIKTVYDIERSLLVSVDFSTSYDVEYKSPTGDQFLIVDNYGGFHKFLFLNGRTTYQEHIESNGIAWSLTLDE